MSAVNSTTAHYVCHRFIKRLRALKLNQRDWGILDASALPRSGCKSRIGGHSTCFLKAFQVCTLQPAECVLIVRSNSPRSCLSASSLTTTDTVLLESGLDANTKDARGSPPLEYALQVDAERHCMAITQLLNQQQGRLV